MCEETKTFDTEESLIQSIKGEYKGTSKTDIGHALHAIVEGQFKFNHNNVIADGVRFTKEQALPVLRYRQKFQGMINEVPVVKIYPAGKTDIQISGRIDTFHGLSLRDAKFTFRPWEAESYIKSCQWKLYLDMTDADRFVYDIFKVNKFKDLPDDLIVPKNVEIEEPEQVECVRYSSMEADIAVILNEFADYIKFRNLEAYLKPCKETIF